MQTSRLKDEGKKSVTQHTNKIKMFIYFYSSTVTDIQTSTHVQFCCDLPTCMSSALVQPATASLQALLHEPKWGREWVLRHASGSSWPADFTKKISNYN